MRKRIVAGIICTVIAAGIGAGAYGISEARSREAEITTENSNDAEDENSSAADEAIIDAEKMDETDIDESAVNDLSNEAKDNADSEKTADGKCYAADLLNDSGLMVAGNEANTKDETKEDAKEEGLTNAVNSAEVNEKDMQAGNEKTVANSENAVASVSDKNDSSAKKENDSSGKVSNVSDEKNQGSYNPMEDIDYDVVVIPSKKNDSNTSNSQINTTTDNEVFTQGGTTEHQHVWVEQTKTVHHDETGHYEKVRVQGDYYETIREDHWFCGYCGIDLTISGLDPSRHCALCGPPTPEDSPLYPKYKTQGSNWYSDSIVVDRVYHEAVYEDRWIVDSYAYDENQVVGYKCSCGATK